MPMNNSPYADSAQARETDRVANVAAVVNNGHTVDLEAERAREARYRAGFKVRLNSALDQLEAFFK